MKTGRWITEQQALRAKEENLRRLARWEKVEGWDTKSIPEVINNLQDRFVISVSWGRSDLY